MITIDMKMPNDCNSCLIRKIMGCKIANESGWLNNRRDERCLLKEVVRCKDCKHRDPEDHKCDCGHDIQWQLPRSDNWFCADGERRDDDD